MIINLKVFCEHCGTYTLSVRPQEGLSSHTQQCVVCYRWKPTLPELVTHISPTWLASKLSIGTVLQNAEQH